MLVELTSEGYVKRNLGEMNVHGGLLLQDRTQKIKISFLDKTEDKNSKIVVSHVICNTEPEMEIEAPKSFRFDNFGSLHTFMALLLKAKVKLGKDQMDITSENVDFFI